MNDEPVQPFDDAAREREWLAQETAMRRERLHLDPHHDDARTQRYRMLARALRQAPEENLPPDFARQLAVQVGPVRRASSDARIELALIVLPGIALVVGLIVVTMLYGSNWLSPMFALSQPIVASWHLLLPFVACIVFTGLLARVRPSARKH
ncbi:hypothetical protein [Rhodanobacter sp. L36]|uniref:hypothetical protein n=1 Tax=Rhodanobacter sp. L36 TaxID=1747221 RepID=UPI00131E37AD|nr:hypothetical protein [Rhodanobacter sp. L36]